MREKLDIPLDIRAKGIYQEYTPLNRGNEMKPKVRLGDNAAARYEERVERIQRRRERGIEEALEKLYKNATFENLDDVKEILSIGMKNLHPGETMQEAWKNGSGPTLEEMIHDT